MTRAFGNLYNRLMTPEVDNLKSTNRILIAALIIVAFFLGSLTNKLSSGQQTSISPTTAPQQPAASLTDTFISYAKQTGLNKEKFTVCLDSGKYKKNVSGDLSEGEKLGVSGTPAFFINGKFLGGAFPYASFKEIIDKELNGSSSTNYLDYSQSLQNAYTNKQFDPMPKAIDIGSAPTQGSKDAKITLIEFSDFQCSFCSRTLPTTEQIMKVYNGKIKFAYKQFPLNSLHPNAQKAAEASECAKEQGKFWEYHDILFKNQATWSPLPPIAN